MEVFRTTIEADGKIQIPPQVLEQLNFEVGMIVELRIEKKSLLISPILFEHLEQKQTPVNLTKE